MSTVAMLVGYFLLAAPNAAIIDCGWKRPIYKEARAVCLALAHFRKLSCDYDVSYSLSAKSKDQFWLVTLTDVVRPGESTCPTEHVIVCKDTGKLLTGDRNEGCAA